MPRSTKKQLRATWLQVHKWIGLALAILIIPISLTGSALVWHDWLDAQIEPQRHASYGEATMPPSAYAASAKRVIAADERIASIRFDAESGPVVVTATRQLPAGSSGRPERTNVWLNPTNAVVIDKASASSGLVQVMHVLHGSLMVPGWGRTIVGWVGVFMFLSCLTGLWLWWPLTGSFRSGLKWKRRKTVNANLHYFSGFWILIPLAMLSLTGAWISFPKVFGAFESRPAPSANDRARAMRAMPLETPALTADRAVAAAKPHATGRLASIGWPTDQNAEWKIGFSREGGPAEVVVPDATGEAKAPKPPQPETLARTMRRWHDGTGMGPVWQIAIFLGGIIPALLSITGIIIWWRARKPRQKARDYERLVATAP
ncbi:MAG TPA: PepSY-associated TM helix domain-containing protein [Sphingomicrobium sp.]|nr:PepSY-associated TM helix domain-containing protein [Sphingomicrobium sp.]